VGGGFLVKLLDMLPATAIIPGDILLDENLAQHAEIATVTNEPTGEAFAHNSRGSLVHRW
jgi:hypothetical protein